MYNRELKKIIEEIQRKEGLDLTAIAEKVSINRSYLSSFINSSTLKPVTPAYMGKFTKHFPTYFHPTKGTEQKPTDPPNKIDEILANLNEIRDYTIAILTGQSAGHEVMMGSLDRLEQNTEGTLSEAADKLALKIAERLRTIQTGRKAGAHK